MSPFEISVVRSSFQKFAPLADRATALFFARLFELDPSLRDLFQGDRVVQGKKLVAMVALAVNEFDRLESLAPVLRQMSVAQDGDEVPEHHYETFGTALLWTLDKGLGSHFTAETRAAWTEMYWVLAETIKAGAREASVLPAGCAA